VRRELADNFCYYNKNYDSIKGAYDWAKKTLDDHRFVILECEMFVKNKNLVDSHVNFEM
jgi:hypothetical protein